MKDCVKALLSLGLLRQDGWCIILGEKMFAIDGAGEDLLSW